MNIIQLQDRLKGLPEQALVKYVEQPMGEVPIYLALGELQRRSEMKKRFQATQADKPSVAEQLVAEAKPMQMGLGAMAPQQMMPEGQGVGAPQPTPEIDPRQMAASGIAANPQSAVGGTAMMKEGGIVGYAPGGDVQYSDEFIKMLEDQAKLNQGTGGPYGGSVYPKYDKTSYEQAGKYVVKRKDGSLAEVFPGDPGYLTATKYLSPEEIKEGYNFGDIKDIKSEKSIFGAIGLADTYQPFREPYELTKKAKDIKKANEAAEKELLKLDSRARIGADITQQEDDKKGITENNNDADFNTVEEIDKILTNQNNNNNNQGDITIDPNRSTPSFDAFRAFNQMPISGRSFETYKSDLDSMREQAGFDPEFFDKSRKESIDMGLIQAGLAIAGGTSANPLENIAKGANPAISEFAKEQQRLKGAKRLENMASLKGYQDELKEIRGYQAGFLKDYYAFKTANASKSGDLAAKAQKLAFEEMALRYPKGSLNTQFGSDPKRFDEEVNDLYRRILERLKTQGYDASDIVDVTTPFYTEGQSNPNKKSTISDADKKLKDKYNLD